MNVMPYCTIQITKKNDREISEIKLEKLIRKIYTKCLLEDELFHFFYEPNLIIRVSSKDAFSKVEEFLKSRNYAFSFYAYPHPIGFKQYGETKGDIVSENLALFAKIFHTHSVAALTLEKAEHNYYMSTIIKEMFDVIGCPNKQRAEIFEILANFKISANYHDKECPNENSHSEKSALVNALLTRIVPIHKIAYEMMNHKEYFFYMERVIHTMFNPANYTRHEEGVYLLNLAKEMKLKANQNCCVAF